MSLGVHFVKMLIFGIVSGVKGQKVAQNGKNYVSLQILIFDMIVIFGTHV